MLNKLYNYINDNEFRITLYDKKLHIINYKRIISIAEDYISITTNNKKIVIKGKGLALKRLLKDELLITGITYNIEVIEDE